MITTPCAYCREDVSERDTRGLCPDCTEQHRASDDHAPACDCQDCQIRAAIDALTGRFFTPWAAVL